MAESAGQKAEAMRRMRKEQLKKAKQKKSGTLVTDETIGEVLAEVEARGRDSGGKSLGQKIIISSDGTLEGTKIIIDGKEQSEISFLIFKLENNTVQCKLAHDLW